MSEPDSKKTKTDPLLITDPLVILQLKDLTTIDKHNENCENVGFPEFPKGPVLTDMSMIVIHKWLSLHQNIVILDLSGNFYIYIYIYSKYQ